MKDGNGGKSHRKCKCKRKDLSGCKSLCDKDENCKGYAGKDDDSCHFFTTSNCPDDCVALRSGNVGELDGSLTCADVKGYLGCHIKSKNFAYY